MVTLSREQRDVFLRWLALEVMHALEGFHSELNLLLSERELIEDTLEFYDDLKDERDSYPLTTLLRGGLELDNTGSDGTRRSTPLRRLTQRILDHAEEEDAKCGRDPNVLPPRFADLPEGEEKAERTAEYQREAEEERVEMLQLRSVCGAILEAVSMKEAS